MLINRSSSPTLTFTISSSRIESVARAAAMQSDASVTADCVVTSLVLQTLVVVDLALVDVCRRVDGEKGGIRNFWKLSRTTLQRTHASVDNRVELEALLAVAVEAARVVDADLVAVARINVAGALVDVDALVPAPPEAHLAAHTLRGGRRDQGITGHRLPEGLFVDALVVALGVDADHPLAARGLVQALVNVCKGWRERGEGGFHQPDE